jgi:putative zinc finger/helix-turn-helix YgiT family protein
MTTHADVCPVCGEGCLSDRQAQEAVQHKGRSGMVMMCYSECDSCGSDQASTTQARSNKRAVTAFKKRVDGLLEGHEIARLRTAMHLTQAKAAEIFGGGPVAFSKYENDDVVQSEAMDTLIRLAASVPAARNWLFERPDRLNGCLYIFTETHTQSITKATSEPYKLAPNFIYSISRAKPSYIQSSINTNRNSSSKLFEFALSNATDSYHTDIDSHTSASSEKHALVGQSTRRRVYGDEENFEYSLSPAYSESAYDQYSL